MKEKSNGKGRGSGWREPADPTCLGKDGKAKARKHHEVAVKKEAGEALNKPMERKSENKDDREKVTDEIPILTLPKVEGELERTTLDITCPTAKKEWLENVAEANGFEVSFEQNTAHLEIPKGLLDAVLELTDGFEEEFDEKMRQKEDDPDGKDLAAEVVIFHHEMPIPDALLQKFCKEYDAELNEDERRTKISIDENEADNFKEFMSENGGIKLKEVRDKEMKQEHIDTMAEEIVEEVQSKRKPTAVARDNAQTAKNTGEKEDAEALVDWVKNPGKSDLEGVDTAR